MNPTFKSRIPPNVVDDMVPVGFTSLFLSLREPPTEKNSLVSRLFTANCSICNVNLLGGRGQKNAVSEGGAKIWLLGKEVWGG